MALGRRGQLCGRFFFRALRMRVYCTWALFGEGWWTVVIVLGERMSTSDEILQNVSGVCQRVKQALACFEEGEVPDDLDSLIFLVEKLYRLLLALNLTSDAILDSVAVGLSLLQ